jgi:hypothetical protein
MSVCSLQLYATQYQLVKLVRWGRAGGTKIYRYSTKQTEPIKVGSYDLKFGQSQTDVGVIIENTAYRLVTLTVVQRHSFAKTRIYAKMAREPMWCVT